MDGHGISGAANNFVTFDEWLMNNAEFFHDETRIGDLRLAFNAGFKAAKDISVSELKRLLNNNSEKLSDSATISEV